MRRHANDCPVFWEDDKPCNCAMVELVAAEAQLAEANEWAKVAERWWAAATEAGESTAKLYAATQAREAKLRGLAEKLWQKINDWRCRLIQRKLAGDVSERDLAELAELQALADKYLRVIAPLPIAELKQYMRKHGIEIPAQDAPQPAPEK